MEQKQEQKLSNIIQEQKKKLQEQKEKIETSSWKDEVKTKIITNMTNEIATLKKALQKIKQENIHKKAKPKIQEKKILRIQKENIVKSDKFKQEKQLINKLSAYILYFWDQIILEILNNLKKQEIQIDITNLDTNFIKEQQTKIIKEFKRILDCCSTSRVNGTLSMAKRISIINNIINFYSFAVNNNTEQLLKEIAALLELLKKEEIDILITKKYTVEMLEQRKFLATLTYPQAVQDPIMSQVSETGTDDKTSADKNPTNNEKTRHNV